MNIKRIIIEGDSKETKKKEKISITIEKGIETKNKEELKKFLYDLRSSLLCLESYENIFIESYETESSINKLEKKAPSKGKKQIFNRIFGK